MATTYKKVENYLTEQSFVKSAFKSSATLEDLTGLAKRIQNVLLMEPNTIPNYVNAGVGIRRYLMEQATDTTESDAKRLIFSQLRNYLPSAVVDDVSVRIINSTITGKPELTVIVVVRDPTYGATKIGYKLSENVQGKTITDIYI